MEKYSRTSARAAIDRAKIPERGKPINSDLMDFVKTPLAEIFPGACPEKITEIRIKGPCRRYSWRAFQHFLLINVQRPPLVPPIPMFRFDSRCSTCAV